MYNKIIIEFENDLKKTFKHAKEQLAGYILGQINSGEGYNFTLIASDFINWKVVALDIEQLDMLDSLTEDELILNEVPSASFTLNELNADDFYFWIDRFLFKEEKQKATLKRIEEAFGYQSPTFIECFRQISDAFQDVKKYGEVQVSYEQWRKFLSVAYGSYSDKNSAFVIHTYLSVFAKMLAYAILSNDDFIDDEETIAILNGSVFNKYNIQNFVENDFFHWVHQDRNFKKLKKVFRLIAQEISNFEFTDVDEDVLKGVYQELIDLDTRHALGEYYTPDWLCERIVQEYNFKTTDRVLDPACGSGSFLRAAIHRLKVINKNITVEEINSIIYGIDIHPLSVQITKTTMLVALGREVRNSKKPIHLNIILANTLLAPEGIKNLFGGEFQMNIDKDKYYLNTQIFEDVKLFDEALEVCEELAEQTFGKKLETISTFENILKRQYKSGGLTKPIIESFFQIYTGLKKVKEGGRDTIWKFIVQNLYKPYFLSGKFNYIIGNPPWFTYKSIKNEEYQNILNKIAEKYNVKPFKSKNFTHLEIAAIFLAYCSNYFLKEEGNIAFVLPRSFLSADHHDNTRNGDTKGVKLQSIWDLNDVTPLFRVPSCVLFCSNDKYNRKIPKEGLAGLYFNGAVPFHNCNLKIAKSYLNEEKVNWFYSKQGKSSTLATYKIKSKNLENVYKRKFKQGATIVPRTFYFIELAQDEPSEWSDSVINIKTSNSIKTDAKPPWKEISFEGKIESQFIFNSVIGKTLLPFLFFRPELVVLPILVERDKKGSKSIKILDSKGLRQNGFLNASKWFSKCENIWEIHRTEKSKKMTCFDRLNFQKGITDQNLNDNYVVVYSGRGTDACASVYSRLEHELELIVDHANYLISFDNQDEAYYLSSILNSTIPNKLMKEFQSKGLFGARNIHKKILDIYFPQFKSTIKEHILLVELSKKAHEKAATYIVENPPSKELTAIHLGRLRSDIKNYISNEIKEIDKLVKHIIIS